MKKTNQKGFAVQIIILFSMLAVVGVAGYYMVKTKLESKKEADLNAENVVVTELPEGSDDETIETEIEATNVDEVDVELKDLDSDIESL